MQPDPFTYSMLSHPGRVRRGNEDACGASVDLGVFVVCDGMGGAAGGEIASRLAVENFLKQMRAGAASGMPHFSRLQNAVAAANASVFERAVEAPELRGMGTTLVALLITPETYTMSLAHVGDSRAYLLRGDVLYQLTQDHSLVEEQVLAGQITRQQAEVSPMRNVITRAVGSHESVSAEVHSQDLQPGDLFLLASDGLNRELSEAEIAASLAAHQNLDAVATHLIEAANKRGGRDNITVLLVRVAG